MQMCASVSLPVCLIVSILKYRFLSQSIDFLNDVVAPDLLVISVLDLIVNISILWCNIECCCYNLKLDLMMNISIDMNASTCISLCMLLMVA